LGLGASSKDTTRWLRAGGWAAKGLTAINEEAAKAVTIHAFFISVGSLLFLLSLTGCINRLANSEYGAEKKK
jgi:hypothetical protein